MAISIISTAGTDTGESSYSATGTVTNSANITTAIGDVVFVFHSYRPDSFLPIPTTLTGGTGVYSSGTAINIGGNVVSQAFYRISTAAETFKVTSTLATTAYERRINVVVIRSSTGALAFSAGSDFYQAFPSPTWPGANSLTAQSVPNNSIIIAGLSSQSSPGGFVAGSGYTLLSTSDSDVAIYQTNATATSTTPSFTNGATATRIRAGGFVFYEAITYTYARPTSDITTQWTPSTGTDHYALIDETTANDSDYIFATAAGQTDEVKLAAMNTPKAGTSVDVQYRVQGVAGGGKVTLSLVCGTTVIATDAIRSADGDYVLTVAPGTWAAVTDWSNMRLRFVSSI